MVRVVTCPRLCLRSLIALRRWRIKHAARLEQDRLNIRPSHGSAAMPSSASGGCVIAPVADSLEEAGDRLFTFHSPATDPVAQRKDHERDREQRPEQHRSSIGRRQHGLGFDPSLELLVQTLDDVAQPVPLPRAKPLSSGTAYPPPLAPVPGNG
jgi:hypothetical protein